MNLDQQEVIEAMTRALLELAVKYGLGTEASRAIVTATEHARIKVGAAPAPTS